MNSVQKSTKITKLIICTNHNDIFEFTASLGIETYKLIANHVPEKSSLLPSGTNISVQYLLKSKRIPDDNLLIINHRNLLLTTSILNQAIQNSDLNTNSCLISVKAVEDHPCQCYSYLNILDAGFIHLLENPEQTKYILNSTIKEHPVGIDLNDYQKLSKPFYFDWHTRGINKNCPTSVFYRYCSPQKTCYSPVKEIPQADNQKKLTLWIYDSALSARLLFASEIINFFSNKTIVNDHLETVAGLCNPGYEQIQTPLICSNNNSGQYFLKINTHQLSEGTFLVRLLPVTRHNSFESDLTEFETESEHIINIPLLTINDKTVGFIYTLYVIAEDDSYDLKEPFPHNGSLWTSNNFSSKIQNTATGNSIVGRQDFSPVFEPDGTLFIANPVYFENFDQEILKGNARSFILKSGNSLLINSSFDLLKYKALIKSYRYAQAI